MAESEAQLQERVARYLQQNYPDVLFHSDFGSGVKLTKGQAIRQKRQNGGRRSWPDMFIAQKTTATVTGKRGGLKQMFYGGLFLELKKDGTRLTKARNPDEWVSEHIAEQAATLRELRNRGYMAEFAVGFDQAVEIIEHYLGKPKPQKVEF